MMQRKVLWGSGAAAAVAALALLLPGATFAQTATALSNRTITVTGSALEPVSTSTVTQISVNVTASGGKSAVTAVSQLQKEANAVMLATEKQGVPPTDISVNNQSFYWNNAGIKGKITAGLNGNETILINVTPKQTQAVFDAVVRVLSGFSSTQGNDNVYVNPGSQVEPSNASAQGLDAAIAAASREASAVAHRMGVVLGPIQSVTQETYNGPQPGNQIGVSVQVVFATQR